MGTTLNPAALRRRAIEAVAIPLPIPDMTPPETKIYFIIREGFLDSDF